MSVETTAHILNTVWDKDGNSIKISPQQSFELQVTMGMVDGYSTQDKFGSNPAITTASDPEDIWEGGGTYTYDADGTAPIVSLASSSSDTEPITVTGLDVDGNEVEQTLKLTGTSRVALTTPLWRVYGMQNAGTKDFAGNVFCYTGTGTVPSIGDSEVRAVVINGNNQTLMALYTIPVGKVGFLYRGEVGINWEGGVFSGTEFAKCFYKSRRFGKVFTIKKDISLVSSGNTIFQDRRSFPDVIPAKTDIKLVVEEVSATMGAWGAFDIILVDEDKLSTAYLQAIGQPGY